MKKFKIINDSWFFSQTAKEAPKSLPLDWETLNLPHTWNGKDGQDGGGDYARQVAYYAKEISADELSGEENYLEFDAVNSTAEIFWNGKSLMIHHGGYSRFRVLIPSDDIKQTNLLVVSADNRANDFVYPQTADFTFYGGIYRPVKIINVPASHFDLEYFGGSGLMVTPVVKGENAEVTAKAFVKNGADCEITFKIYDGDDVIKEATVSANDGEAVLTIENAHLWNGRKDPFLYCLEATLTKNGEEIDSVCTRFGCRYFSVDPEKGFFLNGKEYPLRGVSRHQDYPEIGNALTYEHHKRDIEFIMEVGATTIRLAHYQHSQDFYDLCDENGLIIWAEIPYISRHMPKGLDNTVSQMKELVTQNYNHPCIVTWGVSNEITIAGSDPDLLNNHKVLNNLIHEMDKTRLTTLAAVTMCSPDDPVVHLTDIVSYNHYFGWYGGTTDMNGKWFDDFHKKYPNRAIGISEYGCEALNWHTSNPTQGDYTEEYQSFYHEELIKQIADRPYLWATHVWNMFDFAADARAEGGENGMNHKGLMTFDRSYKKDSFYAYKAWLSDEKVLHICSKRYIDRVEDVTKVTVYSNCDEIELFANGVSVGKQKKGKYPFFYFEIKNEGETALVVKADGLEDTATIRKVDTPNEDYIMKEEGDVINWFEINMPDGYLSINDTLGDIMATFSGKIAAVKIGLKLKKALTGPKTKEVDADGKEKESGGMEVAGFKLTPGMLKNVYGMAKGFTVKRALSMMGGKFSKEEVLEINAILNKVKKKK